MTPTSWLEINLDRLRDNVQWWQRLVTRAAPDHPPLLGAVVKANAYGLGAVPIARALEQMVQMVQPGEPGQPVEPGQPGEPGSGVAVLLVYCPAEAVELLEAAITSPILIFVPTRDLDDPLLRQAVGRGQVQLSLDALDQLEALDALGRSLPGPIRVHLHVDTGMSRAGFPPDQAAAALEALPRRTGLRLAGIYSHFATAASNPDFLDQQNRRLDAFVDQHRAAIAACGHDIALHISSTYSACRHQPSLRHIVRVGLGLYGYGPELVNAPLLSADPPPQPVLRWVSRIAHVQTWPAGATVSYERSFTLTRPSRLAVVPAGYGAGYPWALGNKSAVRVLDANGNPLGDAPLRGQVNMDQIVIDLTDLPANVTASIAVGSHVELISPDPAAPCSLPKLAALATSTPYELLCRLSPRLPRQYVAADTA
jgi:alanine racemase